MKIVLSCEHASAAIPPGYDPLFEGDAQAILWSHRGWDPGALRLARTLGEVFGCPLIKGEWTRLLLDLNRSQGNPERWSEFSTSLDNARREALEELVFIPYWNALKSEIETGVTDYGCVLHLSIHSFVRVFNGMERDMDLGILFDPDRNKESRFAGALRATLQGRAGNVSRIRENVPYAGTDDGLTGLLRDLFADEQYLGIELEVCSDLLEETKSIRKIGGDLATAILDVLNDPPIKLSAEDGNRH